MIDVVGQAQDVELLARDLARAADRKAGPGKRMAADEGLGQAELAAERAHLVLEQFAQRLDQLHVHALGQAADIVVRLDRHRRPAGERHALDHVGIERALRQEFRAADLLRLGLEHVDEQPADGLALLLRIADAVERVEKQSSRLRRARAECCSCRGTARRPSRASPSRSRPWSTNTQVSCSPIASWISTAATAESTPPDSPQITRPLPTCARIFSIASSLEGAHGPVAARAGDLAHEIAQQRRAVRRVHDFGMELQPRRTCASRRRSRRTARSAMRRPRWKPGGSLVTRSPWLIQTG